MAELKKMAPARRGGHGDPVGKGKSDGVGAGGIVVATVGIGFVSYVYNVGGLRVWMDGLFGGVNRAALDHHEGVAAVYLMVLPLVGALLVLGLLATLFSAGGSGAKKKKRSGKAKAATEGSAAGNAVEAQAFIRPFRPAGVVEQGVLLETKRPG